MNALGSVQARLPAATQVGNPAINIAIFAAFVVVTLGIVIWAAAQQPARPRTTTPAAARSPGAERHRDLR